MVSVNRLRRNATRACLALAVCAASTVTLQASPTAAAAAADRPTLTFADSGVQAKLGAAYTKALADLLDINTVRYDPSEYDRSGLMKDLPGTFIRAGSAYPQPWTRDGSVNPWNAASLIEPQVAANTLWSVVDKQSNGQLELLQDNQWWDQVVWLTAAWNHYLVTGDQSFLGNAYQTARNTLDIRRSRNYNASYGLFQGPAFFNDGIAGYPEPPADATESKGSFVGDYNGTDTQMTLSTNALYYSAYRSAARMAAALGRPASEVSALDGSADALKTKINEYFWISGKGNYGYFIHGDDGKAGQLDQSEEGTGLSFVILFDIASAHQAQSVLQHTHLQPHGIADVYPNFARYNDDRPGRHNVIIWPMVQGFWAGAAAHAGDVDRFAGEVTKLSDMANASDGFYEIYNARTGEPDGGWQTGGHWGPLEDQTWSATAYLRMIHEGLFGMRPTGNGMAFQPTLPTGWGDVSLTDVRYRGATLNISLHGAGTQISSFTLDGAARTDYTVPTNLSGTHKVDITLSGTGGSATNLALNRPATGTTSCNGNETPNNAVNGSVSGGNSDKWCSGASDKWLQVDLGSATHIESFTVRHAQAGGEIRDLEHPRLRHPGVHGHQQLEHRRPGPRQHRGRH